MFTGIVAAVGSIDSVVAQGDGVRMRVRTSTLDLDDVGIGDSIAVEGCCLTVVERDAEARLLAFDLSAETLRCTAGFAAGARVNLEKSLRLSDRLGGHLVSGHVDGVGRVSEYGNVPAMLAGAPSVRLVVEAPQAVARYIAAKGSVAVNGVSLTVNRVTDSAQGCEFSINLIPHTIANTTLGLLKPGSQVNLEVDLIARYVARMLESAAPAAR